MAASSRPVTTDSVSFAPPMSPSLPPSSQGRRLRENLASRGSLKSSHSVASSTYEEILSERRAKEQEELLEKQDELRLELANVATNLKTCRLGLQKVNGSLIVERNRLQIKKESLKLAQEEVEVRKKRTAVAQNTYELANFAHQDQQVAASTAQLWTQEATDATQVHEARLIEVKARVEELEEISRRCNEAALDAERIKDKELLRARRAREVAEIDRVRYSEVKRLVPPLEEPVIRLKEQHAPLDHAATIAEDRAMAARNRLELCSSREFELQQARDDFLEALPKLRIERDNGYIHREEAKYNLEQASRFIVEHRYQKAFFKRSYENTAPSPLDGKILEAVGNIKDRDYTDIWGEKGIGPHLINLEMAQMLFKLEEQAVVNCERSLADASRDFDIQHEELLTARNANESLHHEAQKRRALADDMVVRIEGAEARLQEAKTKVDECEARSKESTAAMEAQVQIADEALENANRASEDWAQARMKADLEILRVEELEEVCAEARKKLEASTRSEEAEMAKLQQLEERAQGLLTAVEEAKAAEEVAQKALIVKNAELDFQHTKLAKSNVKKDEMEGDVKAAVRAQATMAETLRGMQRVYKFEEDRHKRQENIARTRIVESQGALHVQSMRKELEDEMFSSRLRGSFRSVAEQVVQGVEHHVAACGLQAMVGISDQKQRDRAGGKEFLQNPSIGANVNLCFKHMANVFQTLNNGATILRASSSCRPSDMKGWVSQNSNHRCLKFSALSGRPIESGRHSWKYVIEELSGKGLLLVGVVRDASAAMSAPITEPRVLGRCSTTTVRRGIRFEAGTSDSFQIDLNSWALGDCDKTWALSSDGVKMHDGKSMIMYLHVESAQEECDNGEISTTGKVTDFTGESVHEGCIIQVFLDLHEKTLAFSLNGKQLGLQMHGVEGPVIPALSVTRAATCRVTICDYLRA